MARIEITATLKNDYAYEAPAYGYGYETRHIYTFEADGRVYVWKSSALLGYYTPAEGADFVRINAKGVREMFVLINPGDVVRLKATVKGESEYKGQPQTVLSRVSVLERTFRAKTREEIAAEEEALRKAKKAAQLATVGEDDFIWYDMPYKQYKDHYSDCEVVIDSFRRIMGRSFVDVIIREGRLKESGVRGQHFAGYEFFVIGGDGKKTRTVYRAVCEDNALRRLHKEFPDAVDVIPGKIYYYGM